MAESKGGRPISGSSVPPAATRRSAARSNISGARKSAGSVWTRSTTSITKTSRLLSSFMTRARQDHAAADFGRVRAASAAVGGSDQAGAQHRADAVLDDSKSQQEIIMEVILREDIEKLGNRGDVVKVAPGYARNFLLPRRMAVAANESNKKIVEQERQAHLRKEAKVQADAADSAKLMSGSKSPSRRRPARTISCSDRSRRRYRGGAREAGLHHRAPQGASRRADQDAGRFQGHGAAAQK